MNNPWNDVKEYLRTNSIKPFPSKNGVVIAQTYQNDDSTDVTNYDDIDVLVAELTPLVPENYRVTILPTSRRHNSDAIFIGLNVDMVDTCFDKMPSKK